jgi:tRNA U55 pseudouridine synthase TruB
LPENLSVLKLTIEVGSGFYVRQLAEDLGRELGTGACLYSLVRTEIRK